MHFHDFSPYLWRISENFGIQWNGLSYMLSLLISFVFVGWMSYRQRSELVPKLIGDFLITCALGVLIGGRLGYCLFYSPDLFIKFRGDFPFWAVLAVGEGGMSSFGGIVGLAIASTIFAVRTGISRLYLYDLIAVTAPIGLFLGRIANYLTGEFIGRPATMDLPLTVKFPSEIYYWPSLDPHRLSELGPVVEKSGIDASQWPTVISEYATNPEAKNFVHDALVKVVDAVHNGNVEARNLLEPLLAPRHAAQLYGAAFEGVFLFFFLFFLWYKPRRPGVIAASFLVLYSVIRFVVENYRMPDVMMGFDALDLTRGQWLSIITFVIGLVLLFIWGRRETLPSSGWGRGHSVKLHRR